MKTSRWPLCTIAIAGCASGQVHVTGDAATPAPDGARAPDASAPAPDASTPDAGVTLGLSWPASQVFPSFAPVAPLDVVATSGLAPDVLTLTVTLEGVVNRTRPRIYLHGGGSSDQLWLDELAVATTPVADPLTLVSKYQGELAGIVVTDDAQPDTINLATTIAGQTGAIVASPALAATLTAPPYSMHVVADLRDQHFGSNLAIYQYELDHYAAAATHRLICGLTPDIRGNLRDYAVATGAMMVWLDPRVPAEKSLLDQFLALLPPNSPYLGWWKDEPSGVASAASHGVPVYAADWSSNLTVLGGSTRGSAVVPSPPPPPPLEDKVYVAIFMSDGDNLQEDQGLIPLKWADAARGAVPISWTINPGLVDVAPIILRYFQRTATVDDLLVAGPSGLGYTYPAAWPAGAFDQYAAVSGAYMDAAGLRVSTVWNNGVDLADADAHSYAAHIPSLLGLTIQDESQALRLIDGHLPLVRMNLSYGDSAAILESGIDPERAAFTGAAPRFVTVQGNMNMGPINPSAFRDVAAHYANDTDVVFVRADHFFELLDRASRPPQHQLFDGDFDGDGKSDQLFYYGGDGNWWMGLSDGHTLTWHLAGNVTPDLIDGHHAIYTGDVDGNHTTDVLVYNGADSTWSLGLSDGHTLTWHAIAAGSGVTGLLDGRHRVSIGDYTGDGRADVLVYAAADGSWRLGTSTGTSLTWSVVSQSGGFGDLLDGHHVFFDGDWNGDGKRDVLFAYNGDSHWWIGLSNGASLDWTLASDTSNFGNLLDGSHRVLVGDWNGDHKTDLLFHYAGDGNWWMGTSDGAHFTWSLAGTTSGMGNLLDLGHQLFVGDHDGDGRSDVLAYDDAAGTWWLGRSTGTALAWSSFDDSSALGDLLAPGRRLTLGDFDGDGKIDALDYDSASGDWKLRAASATWQLAGNTSGFGDLMH